MFKTILKTISNLTSPYRGARLKFRSLLFYKRLISFKFRPHSLARGLFIGLLIGFTPLLGFQILLAVLLASLFKGNKLIAVLATFISNTFTIVPIFAFNIKVGKMLLGIEDLTHNISLIDKSFTFSYILGVSSHAMLPLIIGSLFVGTVVATVVSVGVLYSYSYFHNKDKRLKIKENIILSSVVEEEEK